MTASTLGSTLPMYTHECLKTMSQTKREVFFFLAVKQKNLDGRIE
jgi:hypothetical protein